MAEATTKISGGKTVNLELDLEDRQVVNARIRGDFFLEPANKLRELEEKLEGLETGSGNQKIVERLKEVEVDLIGFGRKDIAETFQKAVGEEE